MKVYQTHPTIDAAEVLPNLWIGSQAPTGSALRDGGFDVLVLCAEEWQPAASKFKGIRVHHAPFDDDSEGMTQGELDTAATAAFETLRHLRKGRRVLVTCWAGRNRSGLVTAWALSMYTGLDPALAGEAVREARGSAALTNPHFVDVLNQLREDDCQLCEAEEITRRYHEDSLCWVADCATCGVPMVVLRRHSTQPTRREVAHMLDMLQLCCPPHKKGYSIDLERRSIPDHWHCHARPK